MEVIIHQVIKNHTQHQIKKKMIITSMLRRQEWMADDYELDYILENSQRVLGLSAQYENHPYAEEFTKQCNVMFIYRTYAAEEETDSKFSFGGIWNLFQEPNNTSNFWRQMINCIKASNYLQKNIRSSTEHPDH